MLALSWKKKKSLLNAAERSSEVKTKMTVRIGLMKVTLTKEISESK